ncbi:MAG: HAMP domain-containing protein [Pseudomonadota bacterium]
MGKSELTSDNAAIGRFDRSFLVHMIKDFFVILLIVSILEFAVKAGMVYWDFRTNGQEKSLEVANELADNVRSIMRNEGGPVAAATIYPILEQNWKDIGFAVAVEPSAITVDAIEENFDFTPKGIPAVWDEGYYQLATVEIAATSEYCLSCHTTARLGDVLGSVTVRSYFANELVKWWEGVQLTAGIAVGKIVLHSILLFLLLRARLEPLLGLRAVVSTLARAYGGLNHRAPLKSEDEFGALSRDLNLFLDRITRLIGELDSVLKRVIEVNDDILSIQTDLRDRVSGVLSQTRTLERRAMVSAKREPLLSAEWFEAIKDAIADLDTAVAGKNAPQAEPLLERLQAVVTHAQAQIASNETLFTDLAELGSETEQFQTAMTEMIRLEERMKLIIETGSTLVDRLKPEGEPITSTA